MKKAIITLGILGLVVLPNGLSNKFDNFSNCFGTIGKRCNQFDYDRNGVVGISDFGIFSQKFTKMIK